MKIEDLRPMTEGVAPIKDEERQLRMEKAGRLMVEHQLDALVMEGGSSMFYFTGTSWGLSERTFALVMSARGDLVWVCPAFEEDRARELIRFGDDIRTWEEDENPYRLIGDVFREWGVSTARVGLEERLRFFVYDGIRQQAPQVEYRSADPVTIGCRSIKSPQEIALLQRSNDIAVQAFKATIAQLREGMTKEDFHRDSVAAFRALGVEGGIGANFGEHSALPHGSSKPRTLREGDVVLMDGGCSLQGYKSDITRTIVFGPPNAKQREVWEWEKKAQQAAFAASKPGVSHESIDAAARKVITDAGYGPGYAVPGLPHRTGHGIGLDGHEWTYLVKGNRDPVCPRMCFTNEPTIVIPGEFGIRLEDDMYITEDGVEWFTEPSPAIEEPFRE